MQLRGVGQSGPIPTSSITTSSTKAGTSRHGSNQSYSRKSCGLHLNHCASWENQGCTNGALHQGFLAHSARAARSHAPHHPYHPSCPHAGPPACATEDALHRPRLRHLGPRGHARQALRTIRILRPTVSKLINAYISETLCSL